jgi:RNA methyltransferase, TrmH family
MKKEISSLQNPLVKHWVRLRDDTDYRAQQQTLIIEGLKPIREVPKHLLVSLVYCDQSLAQDHADVEQYQVTGPIMRKMSSMISPEGVFAEVKMPLKGKLELFQRVLALDGINDPGNMGTILRTALAFGWEAVCLLPNCCDPYNDKVLRAARGAHFRLPLAEATAEELQNLAVEKKWQPLVADIHGTDPENISTPKGCLLVLGNEAHGPSPAILKFCSKVTLPMTGNVESLNVAIAGGILMYLLRRR